MVKIAFGFERRVGKDTSCDYLISKIGGVKLAFAEPLYKILNFAQDTCKFEHCKDRKFLQYIGTEWARNIDENIWLNLLLDKVNHINGKSNIFVSDLRFKNEFDALKSNGFITIRIKRNIEELDGYKNHQSDLDLNNFNGWDYTIYNTNNIHGLYSQLDDIIKIYGSNNISE
jgi:hypothetical protein